MLPRAAGYAALLLGRELGAGWGCSCSGAWSQAATTTAAIAQRRFAAANAPGNSGGGGDRDGAPSSPSASASSSLSLADEFKRRALYGQPLQLHAAASTRLVSTSRRAAYASAAGPGAEDGGSSGSSSTNNSDNGGDTLEALRRGEPHPVHGFAALGGVDPAAADAEAGAQQPKLHPRRAFHPGDRYQPHQLNAYGDDGPGGAGGAAGAADALRISLRRPNAPPPFRPDFTPDEVRAALDFRNTALLRQLVTESGRMRPQRQTRLPRLLQVKAARAVKLARQMALLPFEMVVGAGAPDARARMAEYEAARRGGSGGGGGGGGVGGSGRQQSRLRGGRGNGGFRRGGGGGGGGWADLGGGATL